MLSIILVIASSAHAADFFDRPLPFASTFRTTYAQGLGPNSAKSALVFDPSLGFPIDIERRIELATSIERPTDPYQNFALPRTTLTFTQKMTVGNRFATSAHYVANALSIDDWRNGHRLRQSVIGELAYEPFSRVSLVFRAGPFHQWNKYRQSPSGENLPRYGLYEQARLAYRPGRFVFDLRLTLNQSYRGVWANEYATQETVSYAIFDGVLFGIGHELTTGAIDETTGFSRPFRVFDGKESRLNTFVELSL